MLPSSNNYETARDKFQWNIPEYYNIGVDVCDRWAELAPQRTALIHERQDGIVECLSFEELYRYSNQAANCMRSCGVKPGDRVAILLGQSPQCAITHIAAYKAGAIAVPLFSLFGPEALEFRLRDSEACMLVTDREGASKIAMIRDRLPNLATVLVTELGDASSANMSSFEKMLACEIDTFEPQRTRAEDPALIIYTSGTTGKPKGALHAHRVLLGHLPGVEMSHGGRIEPSDIFWTPADWAWIGGLIDVLLPALHHGVPVVAHRFTKFDGAAAFRLMSRHRVSNVFLPPTALKMMRAQVDPTTHLPLHLRSVASGGESLGTSMQEWGRETLGVTINEFYGQTECNMIVSSCSTWFDVTPGTIGKAVPGHEVHILDTHGRIAPTGAVGQIAVRSPDPVMFLGYWNNSESTSAKYCGDFLVTGDSGCMDTNGLIRFLGRDDDVITSAGYRIGPGPIEDCLLGHPAVRMAAVVGIPDAERTEIVKAFIVLADQIEPSDALTKELQHHVRTQLAAHEYPRIIEYLTELPTTATGKVIRGDLRRR